MFHPELSRRECGGDDGDDVVLQRVSRTEARDGDVLLPVIAIERRFALYWRAEVLDRIWSGGDRSAIRFQYAQVRDFNSLVRRTVAEDDLPPLLHSSFALHFDANIELSLARAIVLEGVGGIPLLDDEAFLGIIRSFALCLGRGRRRRWSNLRTAKNAKRREKGEKQRTQHSHVAS